MATELAVVALAIISPQSKAAVPRRSSERLAVHVEHDGGDRPGVRQKNPKALLRRRYPLGKPAIQAARQPAGVVRRYCAGGNRFVRGLEARQLRSRPGFPEPKVTVPSSRQHLTPVRRIGATEYLASVTAG